MLGCFILILMLRESLGMMNGEIVSSLDTSFEQINQMYIQSFSRKVKLDEFVVSPANAAGLIERKINLLGPLTESQQKQLTALQDFVSSKQDGESWFKFYDINEDNITIIWMCVRRDSTKTGDDYKIYQSKLVARIDEHESLMKGGEKFTKFIDSVAEMVRGKIHSLFETPIGKNNNKDESNGNQTSNSNNMSLNSIFTYCMIALSAYLLFKLPSKLFKSSKEVPKKYDSIEELLDSIHERVLSAFPGADTIVRDKNRIKIISKENEQNEIFEFNCKITNSNSNELQISSKD